MRISEELYGPEDVSRILVFYAQIMLGPKKRDAFEAMGRAILMYGTARIALKDGRLDTPSRGTVSWEMTPQGLRVAVDTAD